MPAAWHENKRNPAMPGRVDPMALHRALRRMAGLVFLLVFWVLAGTCQRHGVGGFLLRNTTTTGGCAQRFGEVFIINLPRPPVGPICGGEVASCTALPLPRPCCGGVGRCEGWRRHRAEARAAPALGPRAFLNWCVQGSAVEQKSAASRKDQGERGERNESGSEQPPRHHRPFSPRRAGRLLAAPFTSHTARVVRRTDRAWRRRSPSRGSLTPR